jgi:hypothetical protein
VRDLRDPQKFGPIYLALRQGGTTIREAVTASAPNYVNGKFISNDPAKHHSKTPQTKGDLTT